MKMNNMKKLFLAAMSAAAAMTFAAKASAVTPSDSTRTVLSDSVSISENGDNHFIVSVLGHKIGISPKDNDTETTSSDCHGWTSDFGDLAMEFGVSPIVGIDYAGYAEKGFLDPTGLGGFHFGFDAWSAGYEFMSGASIRTGLRFEVDDHLLPDSYTIKCENGRILPVMTPEGTKKSKLTMAWLCIPLKVTMPLTSDWEVGFWGEAGFLGKSHTKYKKPKVKDKGVGGLNKFRFSAGAMMTFDDIGVFCEYTFTPLFKDGYGPDAHTLSAGILLNM